MQPHHHEKWQNHVEKNNVGGSYQEKQQALLTLLKDKVIYETAAELRTRINKLKDILVEKNKKYKRIAIVSHYYIVRTLLAEEFMENGEIINPKIIQNAEPYHCSL